jgi:hypothetical protein
LLLIADGPRADKEGEEDVCRQVRDIVSRVDWPCEVVRDFSESNLGCQERMISGLNWVFSSVEEAIILEDDCLPNPSFFPFCQELLERYRGDARISYISGTNLVEGCVRTADSYYFSQIGGIWGWATWRTEWQRYDRHLSDWPKLKGEKILCEVFDQPRHAAFWISIFDAMYEKRGPNTWDHQWAYTHLKNNAVIIIPRVNLVANLGFGPDATHTVQLNSRLTPPAKSIDFPLRHPCSLIPLRSVDRRFQDLFAVTFFQRALRKILRPATRLRKRLLVGLAKH